MQVGGQITGLMIIAGKAIQNKFKNLKAEPSWANLSQA